MFIRGLILSLSSIGILLAVGTCVSEEPNRFPELGTVDMTIKGTPFRLWIADSFTETQRGLMFVSAEEMAPLEDGTERGMIFVFSAEQHLSFWMRNTIIPLDIAYLTTEGEVVSTYTMAPLDERIGQYPSKSPARFAIEVNAGVWQRIGLEDHDVIEIPQSLLNR